MLSAERVKEFIKNEFMVVKALGVVYGDIGTSPIYTLAVIFLVMDATKDNIFGILSLITWTLILLVTIQYAWLATSLSKRGEGGTVVLIQILTQYVSNAKQKAVLTVLSFVGISLIIGDGVITPAISILSAVEGITLIPGLEKTPRIELLLLASVIALGLFFVQKKGIERVAAAFGPIMIIWFVSLLLGGLTYIQEMPSVFVALSPHYAVSFIINHPILTFIILADVILCATGGEALYADMGHLGRLPILKGWVFVFFALLLCYFGQAAFILSHPEGIKSPLFMMMQDAAPELYIPFLLLTITATIIASQAMISGIFSILYQAMTTRIFPHFKVEYTSHELRSQVYVPFVNWFLFVCVIIMFFVFQESAKLASAYGLAITGDMTITGFMISLIFYYRRKPINMTFAIITCLASFTFFLSCTMKIPHGGFWSLIIASVPMAVVIAYTHGQKMLYNAFIPIKTEDFIDQYDKRYRKGNVIEGTSLFFARRVDAIPAYIPKTMFQNGIIYERNIIVIVKSSQEPYGTETILSKMADTEGLYVLKIITGYMEMLDVEKELKAIDIEERVIFYGQEEIITKRIRASLFAIIKNVSPSFVHFYKFPQEKLIGITRRIEL